MRCHAEKRDEVNTVQCPHCSAPIALAAQSCPACGAVLSAPASPGPAFPGDRPVPAWTPQQLASRSSITAPTRRRHAGRRWLLGCLGTLVILLVLLLAAWALLIRPTLNQLAKEQLNATLDSAVQEIDPARTAQLPGGPVRISETVLNNLLTLAHSPSSPMQDAHFSVTPSAITLDFTLYGQANHISAVPQASAGQLRVSTLHIQGPISWILSDDDLTTIVNQHLATAQQRLHHPVLAVVLQNHAVDLLLGPSSSANGSSASRLPGVQVGG